MDQAYNFWLNWDKANQIDKRKKAEELAKIIINSAKIKDEKLALHSTSVLLNSYFEDLRDYYEAKK